MFEFQNLEVYKKAKSFHAEMKLFIPYQAFFMPKNFAQKMQKYMHSESKYFSV